jgi:hypothetical protein
MRLLLPFLFFGCGTANDTDDSSSGTKNTEVCANGPHDIWLMRNIMVARPDADGVVVGFDLDDHESTLGGSGGCGVRDFVHPDGTGGIDNAFAMMMPALELTEAAALEEILQSQINAGEVMVTVDIGDIDALQTDECVTVEIGQASGSPDVGTDQWILGGQTFDFDTEVPSAMAAAAWIEDGGVHVEDFSLLLPIQVFEVSFVVEIYNASLYLEPQGDGTATGYFGGAVDIEALVEVVLFENVDPEVYNTIEPLLDLLIDLEPDPETGECTRISSSFTFEAVPAFFYD